MAEQAATYTFTKDYSEPLSDGSGEKVLFKAGQTVLWETARELGLVKGDPPKPKAEPKADK